MRSIVSTPAAIDCAAFFQEEGLPELPLPAALLPTMRSRGGYRFASPGWMAGVGLQEAALRWMQEAPPQRSAFCAVVPRGVHSTLAQVGLVAPHYGFFVSKLVSEALQDAGIQRRKVEGSFKLMKRVVDLCDAAPAWPRGKRLVVVDDDTQGLRWGWVAAGQAAWSDLAPDPVAWLSALVSLSPAGDSGR